ncbi:hypothetical protein F7U73_22205 [Vibrio vulnificus]|nr:hypothetical protein [Vibrio vulnificus]EJL7832807.1 hypothetical protein [Vibrio vulnificus]
MPKDLDFDPMVDEAFKFVKDPNSEGYVLKSKVLDQEIPTEEFRLVAFLDDPSKQFEEDCIPAGIVSLQKISDQIVEQLNEKDLEKIKNGNFEELDIHHEKAFILQTASQLGELWNKFYSKNSRMESMFFEEIDALLGMSMQFGKLLGSYNTSVERDFFYKKGIRYHKLNSRQSEAGKYNKSRYFDDVARIAELTWGRYPEASVAALANKIYSYLQLQYSDRNDLPSKTTIEKTWLYNASFRPHMRPKRNLEFDLIKE